MPFIVATYVYASSQGQCTHSARTNIGSHGAPSVPIPQGQSTAVAPPIPPAPLVPRVVVTAANGQQEQVPPDWASVAAHGGESIAAALEVGRGRGGTGGGGSGQSRREPVRDRSTSSSTKRKASGEDHEGLRQQGRQRKTAGGSCKVVLDDLGQYQPYLQYYISNTPGHATDDLIKRVLEKCSAPLLKGEAILTVHKVECLTKEDDPRTRCWKVMVPFKFKSVMENDELYPEGWRHRKFFGDRKKQNPNKQPRIEDPRLKEAEQELERERIALQQRQEDERNASLQNQSPNGPAQQEATESTENSAGGGLSESSNSSAMQ